MKKIYILKRASTPNVVTIRKADYPESLHILSMKGVMPGEPPLISLGYEIPGAQLTDLLSGIVALPMVSSNFKNIVEDKTDPNVVFFPAKVYGPEPAMKYNYFYAHILNPLPAFDWEKSNYQAASKNASKVTQNWTEKEYALHHDELKWLKKRHHIVLDEKLISNRHLFRVVFIEDLLFCSEELAHSIKTNKLTGIDLILLENYSE